MNFDEKQKYDISDLIEIIRILRSPQGCMWDIEQTHKSLRKNFIEETYEVIEAIDLEDNELLKEELGDVLLQIVFHSQIAYEENEFSFDEVVNGICKKLIIRHPHVFSNVVVNSTEEILSNWETIKMRTKSHKSRSESMVSVAKTLPSLMRSEKIQSKAAKVGVCPESIDVAVDKMLEEVYKLQKVIKDDDSLETEKKLGDLLFSIVAVSRYLKLDPEDSLSRACDNFISKFKILEDYVIENNLSIENLETDELKRFWKKAQE